MFEIKKGNIYHTRGDTVDFDVNITVDELPQTDYTALFSIKKNYNDADYLFQRSIEDGFSTNNPIGIRVDATFTFS